MYVYHNQKNVIRVIYPGTGEEERVSANLGLGGDEKVASRPTRVPRVRGRFEKHEAHAHRQARFVRVREEQRHLVFGEGFGF